MKDHEDFQEDSGAGFMTGLFTGALIGAGLGLLFAPRSGSELRGQIASSASTAGKTIADKYQQASRYVSDTAGEIGSRGKEMYDRARTTMSQVGSEAEHMANSMAEGAGKSFATGSEASKTGTSTGQRSRS